MSIYKGKGSITAEIIARSKWEKNPELVTFRVVYPRFIHGELMTHRLFSRNAASSRAIPITAMIEHVRSNPALPIAWGSNKPGMQAGPEVEQTEACTKIWLQAAENAIVSATLLADAGVHKQVVNRLLEPFQFMTTVVTTCTPGLNNFFNLRLHPDAQPEIEELARLMDQAMINSEPKMLNQGDWHTPFVDWYHNGDQQVFINEHGEVIPLYIAQMISVSCAAQVSFRKNDLSQEKARRIYDRLIMSDVVHASPFEHVALANIPVDPHKSNLPNWVQYRKLIEGEFNPVWR